MTYVYAAHDYAVKFVAAHPVATVNAVIVAVVLDVIVSAYF